jgi:hypothetical protein
MDINPFPAEPPLLLLDFDGVINATRPSWGAAPYRDSVAASNGVTYRVRWAPELTNRLAQLHLAGRLDIVWCSTWCSDTLGLERVLGWPSLGSAFSHLGAKVHAGDAKLKAVEHALTSGRRVIWADDTEVPDPESELYARLQAAGECLLIRPVGRQGLTREHLTAIEGFCGV